jgi:uncharacterized phage protein gp47/JayE
VAFQIKDFTSIAAGMINRAKVTTTRITDFNIGAAFRTLLEAVAIEIDQLYQQFFNGIKEAIPVSVYNSFDFSLLPAIPASGTATVTIAIQATDTLIAAGTVCTPVSGGLYAYTTVQDVTILAGATTASVRTTANVGGAATNLPNGTQFTLNPTPAGFVSATNGASWINGTDLETEDQRKIRFNQFIQALARGTIAALEYGAKTVTVLDANGVIIEQVRLAVVIEPWLTDDTQPIGLVNLFIHNGVGSTSSQLIANTNQVIYGYYDTNGNAVPGWKAAGVKVVVAAATEVDQNITAVLTPLAGYDGPTLNTAATGAISNYILALPIGATLLFAELIYLVMSIPGVDNFVMTVPSADVTVTASQKIMPGTFAITNP